MRLSDVEISLLFSKKSKGTVDKEKISEMVNSIEHNIRLYTVKDDIRIFRRLRFLCRKNHLDHVHDRMLRSTALLYFYDNQTDRSYTIINLVIRKLRKQDNYLFLPVCLADLGYFCFYDMKYKKAKKAFDDAIRLSKESNYPDSLFILYYRAGILYRYIENYEYSQSLLKIAFEKAEGIDKGRSMMNMGINYVYQYNYSEAKKCYNSALTIYGEQNPIERSSIYNNLSEMYKRLGEYEKALSYINKAFELLECKNIEKYFIFFQTYAEIKVLQGESHEVLQKLSDLISQIKDYFIHKCFFIDGVRILKAQPEEKYILFEIDDQLTQMLKDIGNDNTYYKKELQKVLSEVFFSIKVIGGKI